MIIIWVFGSLLVCMSYDLRCAGHIFQKQFKCFVTFDKLGCTGAAKYNVDTQNTEHCKPLK